MDAQDVRNWQGAPVRRKKNPGTVGRVEMIVDQNLARVRWRSGVLEDRVPLNELEYATRVIILDGNTS